MTVDPATHSGHDRAPHEASVATTALRLACSNIAWSFAERGDAYRILAAHDFRGVEIAPGLLFADCDMPFTPGDARIAERKAELADHGLALCSMQSLLFGVSDVALFGDSDARVRFEAAMVRAVRLAGDLGLRNLVFGSPRQRNRPESVSADEADSIALDMFGRLGDLAAGCGCVIALEANPAVYGTNFLTRFQDTVAMAKALSHDAVRLNFDIGSFILNGEAERLANAFEADCDRVSHIHVSEPQLAPAPDPAHHAPIAALLSTARQEEYAHFVSIEMRRQDDGLATLRDKAGALAALAVA